MSQEDEKTSNHPLLAMVDEGNGNYYMRAVERKGVGESEWIVKDIHEELKAWGYPGGGDNELIIKTDGEPAIVALRESVAKYHGGRVIPEQSATGESQSNGKIEVSGKIIRGMIKIYKHQLEEMADMKLESKDVVMQWMIRWAAMAYSRYKKGEDGKTAYERQGRKCRMDVMPFGETVLYRKLEETGDRKRILESKWAEGIWLGHARKSNEVMIGTANGVIRAWSVRRMPDDKKWNRELIKNLKGTPQKHNPNMPGAEVRIDVAVPEPQFPPPEDIYRPAREEGHRRTYLRRSDFDRFG